MAEDWRKFPPIPAATKAVRGPKSAIFGIIGPPGSGKSRTALRLALGVKKVLPGPTLVIDSEAGRSTLFAPAPGQPANPNDPLRPTYDFERIDLDPPFRSDRCWAAIEQAMRNKPSSIIFDNMSSEHQDLGGYLNWHEEEVARMGGNEWAAWGRPAAARKLLLSGMLHLKAPPLIFLTFVAEEKTMQVEQNGKKRVVNKGWTPVAPLMLLKALDLTCILPWDSKGTPIWKSRDLPFEDFIRKWPDELVNLLPPGQITEQHGEILARWAAGDAASAPIATQAVPEPVSAVDRVLAAVKERFPGREGAAARRAALHDHWCVDSPEALRELPAERVHLGLAAFERGMPFDEYLDEQDAARQFEQETNAGREPGSDDE